MDIVNNNDNYNVFCLCLGFNCYKILMLLFNFKGFRIYIYLFCQGYVNEDLEG